MKPSRPALPHGFPSDRQTRPCEEHRRHDLDIQIHVSETSRETCTDKVVRLIRTDSGDETA